ncbi:hypothetical protein [Streptomyces chartreusis]|uniref:hypothetical protein n=1 Tax=Streptomyces chartreusis TaxID=1969 RepID=UPI00362C461E
MGFGAALHSATFVAAPLLAGFSVTVMGLVLRGQADFRWPGATLLLLTASAILLVASLLFGISSQKFLYSEDELKHWWTATEFENRKDDLSEHQQRDFVHWQWQGWRAFACYNLGIATLAAALATLLAPLSRDDCAVAACKGISSVVMAIAALTVLISGSVTSWSVRQMKQPREESS